VADARDDASDSIPRGTAPTVAPGPPRVDEWRVTTPCVRPPSTTPTAYTFISHGVFALELSLLHREQSASWGPAASRPRKVPRANNDQRRRPTDRSGTSAGVRIGKSTTCVPRSRVVRYPDFASLPPTIRGTRASSIICKCARFRGLVDRQPGNRDKSLAEVSGARCGPGPGYWFPEGRMDDRNFNVDAYLPAAYRFLPERAT